MSAEPETVPEEPVEYVGLHDLHWRVTPRPPGKILFEGPDGKFWATLRRGALAGDFLNGLRKIGAASSWRVQGKWTVELPNKPRRPQDKGSQVLYLTCPGRAVVEIVFGADVPGSLEKAFRIAFENRKYEKKPTQGKEKTPHGRPRR